MEYDYPNVHMISCKNIDTNIIKQYHIYVDKCKWLDFVNNDNLRFLKHKKYLLNKLSQQNDGIIMKLSSWNISVLKDEFLQVTKLKHENFIEPICYFEYEEDIINFLCNHEDDVDTNDESAVIIMPYYQNILKTDLNQQSLNTCIKQIVLALYTLLFVYGVNLTHIDLNNVYIHNVNKPVKLKYKLADSTFCIRSNYIVKLDVGTSKKTDIQDIKSYYGLYKNIEYILKHMNIHETANFLRDFECKSDRIIHPLKIINTLLSQIDMEVK